ncbi:Anaphase-promoting complex subunit 1 [Didymosphaeria variabile]|uniref:Anaphase-promoting complex subunit 1 n=1 Tax=Didymosphaeria variabile TaxID=1932322 RepID=A0A9W8XES6_9PLEO|nr:Anaphase-promoting complex subunit 1 [Didymosphaeria variabile]KAJ4348515.1 Anaphase-promoting complex subunit 1 [Didymosphaeria variabile]
MAALHSIGVRKPAALPYLIAESILPADATERDYVWETYHESPDAPEDEVVTTEYHAVWARGGVVRKVFNFTIDKERVVQALLTWFATEEATSTASQGSPSTSDASSTWSHLTQGTQPATDPNSPTDQPPRTLEGRTRALVVILKSQAHVFFLSGATHVVYLPFEVERAFPAARGLLLQRKIAPPQPIPTSPQIPSVPPNSFLSNPQSFLSQNISQSFSQPFRRQGSSLGPSRLSLGAKQAQTPWYLEELARGSSASNTDVLPRLYSFTDPLAELGLVVHVVSGNERASLLTINGSGHRQLKAVDKAEEIVYVSPQNEVHFDQSGNDKPLLLVVTANYETNVFTIWSAAYLEPKSIAHSRKHNATQANSKSRRRSSYGPTAPGTGATTPAVRGHDRVRESLGGARSKTQPTPFQKNTQTRERLSDQAVEDALASQLNPDFDPTRQQKESRRVSSLLSRAELSTSFDKTAFQDLATQRHSLGGSFSASFGASQRSRLSLGNDRTSFGGFSHHRHRASTPGSITSRISLSNVSMDDTFEETMDDTFDTIEDYEELDDLFAPLEANTDQGSIDGLRKELIMTEVARIPVQQYLQVGRFALRDLTSSSQTISKAVLSAAPFNSATLHERKMYLYLIHSSLKHPLECELAITRKRLSPSAAASQSGGSNSAPPRYACVPRYVQVKEMVGYQDLLQLEDGYVKRIVCLASNDSNEPSLTVSAGWGTHLPSQFDIGTARLFSPYALLQDEQSRMTAGLKRTIAPSKPLQQLLSAGPNGSFDIVDGEGRRHQTQIRLEPADTLVANLFRVLRTILPNHAGDLLLDIWWDIRRSLAKQQHSAANADWLSFVTTLFTLATPFVDEKTRKHTQRGRSGLRRNTGRSKDHGEDTESSAWRSMCNRQSTVPHTKSWESAPWRWVQQSKSASVSTSMSPPSKRSSLDQLPPISKQIACKEDLLAASAELARQFNQSAMGKVASDHWRNLSPSAKQDLRISTLSEVVVILHLFREELKLSVLSSDASSTKVGNLAPVLAQLGHWLRWDSCGRRHGGYYDLDGGSTEDWTYEESSFLPNVRLHDQPWDAPPSILEWISTVAGARVYVPFPTLARLVGKSKASPHSSVNIDEVISDVTPRTVALQMFFRDLDASAGPRKAVRLIEHCGLGTDVLSTLPAAAQAPLMEAITRCQSNPPTTWTGSLLRLIGREDLDLSLTPLHDSTQESHLYSGSAESTSQSAHAARDIRTICENSERAEGLISMAESDRHAITRLIFREDRRYMEAHTLVEPMKPSIAFYGYDQRVDDAAILEGQKTLVQWVMVRTLALPVGSSMLKFSSKKPLLTEKFLLAGFSTSCIMKPMGNVVTADRTTYSEEKFFWAFFNQGVSAGLSISRDAQGIDTSWIMYNKPAEVSNRHAGLLLGLGLNGHLKTIEKWLSFKYLTPKHTMTSVGLLLGLSASYMGTMDTLVTRLLSVHVTRMLPSGAAELNLSPYTQTTGLMGIGLLYYDTQHRRMSEVMLSEIEHVDEPDPSEPPDGLRDEAYRLAAGFALGFINIGKGRDLLGLHDMRIVDRLLSVAVAPKPVDIVHILDQATAGAVVAITLIFMKTHDETVARKIDVPDTLPQFDYVRPDTFLLRTLAKHLIMWNYIHVDNAWIIKNLPRDYHEHFNLENINKLRSEQMPFFNILGGLLWSISLKHAGTGDIKVRDFLIRYLDQFMRISRLPALRYDSRLARNTVRNCQDLLALSVATVMAGTGDLELFRRLRALHAQVSPDIAYGSHLAAHMAIGVLFLGGGTYTFSTSNKALASLICAFYPIFPTDVQDSRAHLQAFRHFWVLAAEPRCLVVRDVDTGKAFSSPILVHLKANDRVRQMTAPCLLPELQSISRIETADPAYWPTTLDFTHNPQHLSHFRTTQTLNVRRRAPHDMYATTFSGTLVALNDAQSARFSHSMWNWLFSLPSLAEFSKADVGLILPADPHSSTFLDGAATVVDHRLVLKRLAQSSRARDLWEVRGVFQWAEGVASTGDGKLLWLGREVVERLKVGILERGRAMEG